MLGFAFRGAAAAMPLTARTERALEACYDAILAPARWPSALQLLAESLDAASCTFFEHDRQNSPAPVPHSTDTRRMPISGDAIRPTRLTLMLDRTLNCANRS